MEDAKQAEGQGTGGGGGGPGVTPGGFRLHRRPALAPSGQEAPRWGPLWHWVWPVSRRHRGWRLHYRLTTERPRGPARSGAEEALPCGLSRAGLRPVPHPRDVPRSPPAPHTHCSGCRSLLVAQARPPRAAHTQPPEPGAGPWGRGYQPTPSNPERVVSELAGPRGPEGNRASPSMDFQAILCWCLWYGVWKLSKGQSRKGSGCS